MSARHGPGSLFACAVINLNPTHASSRYPKNRGLVSDHLNKLRPMHHLPHHSQYLCLHLPRTSLGFAARHRTIPMATLCVTCRRGTILHTGSRCRWRSAVVAQRQYCFVPSLHQLHQNGPHLLQLLQWHKITWQPLTEHEKAPVNMKLVRWSFAPLLSALLQERPSSRQQ